MATVIVCDHEGSAATLRINVQTLTDYSTILTFDACSAECASEYLTERLTPASVEPEPTPEPEPEPES